MSYILDALKRADANRQQSVPDLYSRTGWTDTERARRRRGWHPAWLWLASALLVAASFGALWSMLRASSRPDVSPPEMAKVVSPIDPPMQAAAPVAMSTALPASAPTGVPKTATASINVPPAKAPTMPNAPNPPKPTVKSATPPQTQPSASEPKPPSTGLAAVAPTPQPRVVTTTSAPASAPPISAPSMPNMSPVSPPPQPPPLFAALSPEVKGQLPVLSVGGSVYSAQTSARMVVINGQVLREGDRLAPDLTVESIGPKTTTFNWRGSRFQLPH